MILKEIAKKWSKVDFLKLPRVIPCLTVTITMVNRPKLVFADVQPIVLEGLRRVLEPFFNVVELARDGAEAVAAAHRARADAVILDVLLPELGGLESARRIVTENAGAIRVLFFTSLTDAEYVREARRIGASGYLLKSAEAEEIILAVETILKGDDYFSPALTERQPSLLHGIEADRVTPLTPRQIQVLRLVAEGCSNKEIAHLLGISTKTVEFHKSAITSQLGLHSTAELVRYALEHNLVSAIETESK